MVPEPAATNAAVRLETGDDHLAEIVLDRPSALNAVNAAAAEQLVATCALLAADPSVRAVVLRSAMPKAFCVGADLKERNRMSDDELMASRPQARRAYNAVLDLPMPVIAAVEGYALGGGCELALSCDLIVASDTAVFALPEVGLGLIPGGGGTQLLSRRIGLNRAMDLILTTRRVSADEAYAIGLADRRSETGRAAEVARGLAGEIATRSPVAVRQAKRALRFGFDLPIAEGLEVEDACWRTTAQSADRAEGVQAFVGKREPHWPG